MNVLILSGRFGMGHNSAAAAITEELYKTDKDVVINTVDLMEYMYPSMSELIYKGFNKVVNSHPGIYNMMYKASEKVEIDTKLSGSKTNKKIFDLLNMYKPDIIISTIPICARTISAYKGIKNMEIPLVTCVTDISLHTEWITPNTDFYLVPTKEVKEKIAKSGMDRDKIYVVGVPVKQAFKNRHKIKKERNVLIMGGGLGLLPNLDDIMCKLDHVPNLTTTIITGTNRKAYDELQGKYENAEILGYTDRVSDYMAKASLLISKAGGITLFESIHSQTPMFVINPFLAQERRNAKFIEENAIGRVIWRQDEEDFLDLLLDFIDNESNLNGMKDNMEHIKERIIEHDIGEVLAHIQSEVEKTMTERKLENYVLEERYYAL